MGGRSGVSRLIPFRNAHGEVADHAPARPPLKHSE